MKCITVKEEIHGYIRLYPATNANYEKIADAITKELIEAGFDTVVFDYEEDEKFEAKTFAKRLFEKLTAQDFRILNKDFYSFEWGEIKDFDKMPNDYYGF